MQLLTKAALRLQLLLEAVVVAASVGGLHVGSQLSQDSTLLVAQKRLKEVLQLLLGMVAGPVVGSWEEHLRLATTVPTTKLKVARVRLSPPAITGHYEERRSRATGVIIQPHDWEPGPNE